MVTNKFTDIATCRTGQVPKLLLKPCAHAEAAQAGRKVNSPKPRAGTGEAMNQS